MRIGDQSGHVYLQIRLEPDGAATGYAHNALTLADALSFTGPFGRFSVRGSRGGPLLFPAGGTGVSSQQAMIPGVLGAEYGAPITLLHRERTQADLYGDQEFSTLAETRPNFRYMPALSAETEDSDWRGERSFVRNAADRLFACLFKVQTVRPVRRR